MAQAEAELAAAVTEIEATLLELKRERLLAQLGGSTVGGGNSTAASDDTYPIAESDVAHAAPVHSGMQPSSTGGHSDIRIGEERSWPACLHAPPVSAYSSRHVSQALIITSSPRLLHSWDGCMTHALGVAWRHGGMWRCACVWTE